MSPLRQHIVAIPFVLGALLALALTISAPVMPGDVSEHDGIAFGDAWVTGALPVAQKTDVRDVLPVHPSIVKGDRVRVPVAGTVPQAISRATAGAASPPLFLLNRNIRR